VSKGPSDALEQPLNIKSGENPKEVTKEVHKREVSPVGHRSESTGNKAEKRPDSVGKKSEAKPERKLESSGKKGISRN